MAILDAILKKAIQAKLKFMGIDWATIDSVRFVKDDRRVDLTVGLEGEETPVDAALIYRVEGEELLVESVETNRRWMTEAALMMVERKGGKIDLPESVRGMVLKAIS
jgi:hypothetical protein